MALDNLATFASFVSQFTPIKILPWREKKNDSKDNDKLRQEFEMQKTKTSLSSLWIGKRTFIFMSEHLTWRKPTEFLLQILRS